MSTFSKEITLILGTGVIALITATIWYRYNNRKNSIPEEWVEVGSVTNLWIYPLKSGGAMELDEFECTKSGPVFPQENKYTLQDRGFVVYHKKDGRYHNGKSYPKMVLISVTAVSENEVRLDAPGMSPLIMNTSIEDPEPIACSLWGNEFQKCIDCGDKAAAWISQYCCKTDSELRIGLSAGWKRNMKLEPLSRFIGIYDNLHDEDLGVYADIASYMICNKASVEDLNQKLPSAITPLYFRPNIVIDGSKAFAEDDWDWIKIGDDVIFRCVKPCTRCVIVDVDPETGIPIPDHAVLKKLRDYRLVTDEKKRKVEAMGIYAGLRKPGQIKLRDKVYVG